METLVITKGRHGGLLKEPVILQIKDNQSVVDKKVLQYLLNTFRSNAPSLLKFAYENASTLELAKHYLFHRSGSEGSLHNAIYCLERFCRFSNCNPDRLVIICLDEKGYTKPKEIMTIKNRLTDFVADLKLNRKFEQRSIKPYVSYIMTFFFVNGVDIKFPFIIRSNTQYHCRAATRQEVQKILEVANLQEKTVVMMLASGGFRVGTLVLLRYKNVKHDLERNIVPLCIPVDAKHTKGKYRNYFTFINEEAAASLRAYLDLRRLGTFAIEPEQITDDSPLIRCGHSSKSISYQSIHWLLHELYYKAGVNPRVNDDKRYPLSPHSLRRFFQTELCARGMQSDYIKFMMGHYLTNYADVQSKGVEHLRGVYLSAGLNLMPQERMTKLEALKEILSSWGIDPKEILNRRILEQPSAFNLGEKAETDYQI